ncbi:MAG: hypothetical protein AB7W16_10655 [Candidatus Obscuribacterales bacterium]
MSDKPQGKSEKNEEKLDAGKPAARDGVISAGAEGEENQKIHEKSQGYHLVDQSVTEIILHKDVLGLVDQEKGVVHTGAGMVPLVPDNVSHSYAEGLNSIEPSRTNEELEKRLADTTLAWMKKKGMVPEEPQNEVERHDDGSVLLKINAVENSISTEDQAPPWLEAGKRLARLPLDQQMEILGKSLKAGTDHYLWEQKERFWGSAIGTVQGVGEVVVNLARVTDFAAAVIKGDKEAAGKAGAEFGESLGKTIVGGVRLFYAADQYLFNIGYTGDYAKPFRDIATIGQHLDQQWRDLPPREQERIKSKLAAALLADAAIGAGSAKIISKAGTFTEILDTVACEAGAAIGAKSPKALKAVTEAIDKVAERLPDMKKARSGLARSEKEAKAGRLNPEVSTSDVIDNSGIPGEIRRWSNLPEMASDFQIRVSEAAGMARARMSPAEQAIADRLWPEGWNSISTKSGPRYERTLGTFKRHGENGPEISISEFVKQGGSWIRNEELPGTVCHELGHAMNVMLDTDGAISDSRLFVDAFARDWRAAVQGRGSTIEQLFNNQNYWKKTPDGKIWLNKNGRPDIDMAKVRDEVFAETYAQVKGFDPASNFAQLIRDLFKDTASNFMEKEYGWRS